MRTRSHKGQRCAKYDADDKALWKKGYEISVIDKMLIVTAGSDDLPLEMVAKLRGDIIGADGKTEIKSLAIGDDKTEKVKTDREMVDNLTDTI